MSDNEEKNEIFEEKVEAVVEAPPAAEAEAVAPVKKKKAKRVISDAQREKLKQNLAKGRATSLANRQKKAQLRKIKKEEESKADDEKIFQSLKKKLQPDVLKGENDTLKKELEILKNEMKIMREQSKATPAPKAKLIQVLETPQVIERPVKERKKKAKTAATEDSDEEIAPAPKKASPSPAKKKEMSKRDIMKMMRGL